MSEEKIVQPSNEGEVQQSPEQSDSTSKVNEAKPETPKMANPLANRSRADIYERFDKQLNNSDSSSETEESEAGKDLKESPDTDNASSESEVEQKSEKPTSVKKRKVQPEPKVEEKTVPLQALHEARDRFKKINLEYRDYKSSTDNRIQQLEEQLKNLHSKLSDTSSKREDIDDLGVESSSSDPEKQKLLKEINEMKKKYQDFELEKQRQQAIEAEEVNKKRIQKVDEELSTEGYHGFKSVLFETGNELVKLVQEGEITESESRDPNMWKKVYKENIYPKIKGLFVETEKSQSFTEKKSKKKNANLVDYPGSKSKKSIEEEDEDAPVSFDDFNKQQMKEIMDSQRRKLYSRNKR